MNDRIRAHVDYLFSGAPRTKKTQELKEELIANLSDRYADLLSQGMGEEDAYREVVEGIGDVQEIISALEQQNVLNPVVEQHQRQKSALLVSSAVGLYILSFLFPSLSFGRISYTVGIVIMFVCWTVATMLLVYNHLSKPNYKKTEETLVEDFKEWKHGKSRSASLIGTVYSLIWMVALIVFFLLGFFVHAWSVAWIVFIVAAAVCQVVRLIFAYKDGGL